MPSPFPGMDPYLEGTLWPDAHTMLIVSMRVALAAALPEGYFANIDQYVWLSDSEPGVERRGKPDVFVTNGSSGPAQPRSGALAVAEPTIHVTLPTGREVQRKRYIRLIDTNDRSVVTVIELLSPSDKLPKQDRNHYLAKRDEYLAAGVNLIEIDLLRKGRRVPMGRPNPPETDYYILISRAEQYPRADVWAFTVREPIPAIPIPLKPEHAPIPLDIRAGLDRAYDESRYDRQIDYTKPPVPALHPPDAEWADDLLKKHAKRKKK